MLLTPALSDWLFSWLVRPSAKVLLKVRARGFIHLPRTSKILADMGILPIRNHYYEPYISTSGLRRRLDAPRELRGVKMREQAQLELLSSFNFQDELASLPMDPGHLSFGLRNRTFGPVDAGLLYGMIRRYRPGRILEVGCGMSTLLIRRALESGGIDCDHVCIEPFEQPWLEELPVRVIRERVEQLNPRELADSLGSGDLLFIGSSHVVKPQGDVLFLFQEVMPRLAPGVLVHIHDIFTPRDYPESWVLRARVLWTEQYLLETLLCDNPHWEILLAANMLAEDHHEALAEALPILRTHAKGLLPGQSIVFPNSIYIRRREDSSGTP